MDLMDLMDLMDNKLYHNSFPAATNGSSHTPLFLKRRSSFAQGYGGQGGLGGRQYTEADVSAFSREKKFFLFPPTPSALKKDGVAVEGKVCAVTFSDFLLFRQFLRPERAGAVVKVDGDIL